MTEVSFPQPLCAEDIIARAIQEREQLTETDLVKCASIYSQDENGFTWYVNGFHDLLTPTSYEFGESLFDEAVVLRALRKTIHGTTPVDARNRYIRYFLYHNLSADAERTICRDEDEKLPLKEAEQSDIDSLGNLLLEMYSMDDPSANTVQRYDNTIAGLLEKSEELDGTPFSVLPQSRLESLLPHERLKNIYGKIPSIRAHFRLNAFMEGLPLDYEELIDIAKQFPDRELDIFDHYIKRPLDEDGKTEMYAIGDFLDLVVPDRNLDRITLLLDRASQVVAEAGRWKGRNSNELSRLELQLFTEGIRAYLDSQNSETITQIVTAHGNKIEELSEREKYLWQEYKKFNHWKLLSDFRDMSSGQTVDVHDLERDVDPILFDYMELVDGRLALLHNISLCNATFSFENVTARIFENLAEFMQAFGDNQMATIMQDQSEYHNQLADLYENESGDMISEYPEAEAIVFSIMREYTALQIANQTDPLVLYSFYTDHQSALNTLDGYLIISSKAAKIAREQTVGALQRLFSLGYDQLAVDAVKATQPIEDLTPSDVINKYINISKYLLKDVGINALLLDYVVNELVPRVRHGSRQYKILTDISRTLLELESPEQLRS